MLMLKKTDEMSGKNQENVDMDTEEQKFAIVKVENAELKMLCDELKDQLENFTDENIFNVEVVKGVVDRYKMQVQNLKGKLQTAAANNASLVEMEKHNKELLKMNEMYTIKSQEQADIIQQKSKECDELNQEIEKLKIQMHEQRSHEHMFTSTSSYIRSPTNNDSQTSLLSGSFESPDSEFLTFSEEPSSIAHTVTNTEQFSYKQQNLQQIINEQKETIKELNSVNQALKKNFETNGASDCALCIINNEKHTKTKKFNITLQSLLTDSQDKLNNQAGEIAKLKAKNEELENKTIEEELYKEQAKAFQEDFDTERKEKKDVIEEKRNLKMENINLLRRCESLEKDLTRLRDERFLPMPSSPNMAQGYDHGPPQPPPPHYGPRSHNNHHTSVHGVPTRHTNYYEDPSYPQHYPSGNSTNHRPNY